jgi:hypothetical protein
MVSGLLVPTIVARAPKHVGGEVCADPPPASSARDAVESRTVLRNSLPSTRS